MPGKSRPFSADQKGLKAVTLIELLLVVGGIAILTGLGLVVAENVTETTRVSKLENDVAVINSAIQMYKASGGNLPGSPSVQEVVNRLKTQASSSSAARLAGFRGSLVDARLKAEMQNAGEAASSRERALWDASAERLVIATSGASGVRRFVLDETLGGGNYGTEERSTANPRGTQEWVWDYADTNPTASTGPQTPGSGTGAGTIAPTAPVPQQLSAPGFSPPAGTHPIFDFELSVTLSNPNPGGTSQIWYSAGGEDTLYTGQQISVSPGETLLAYAKTIDPDRWTNSNTASATYEGEPIELMAAVSAPSSMTYQAAGGSMQGVAAETPQPATLEITNLGEIPAEYRTGSNFKVVWTYDETDPRTSGTAMESTDFQNIQIDTSISRWTADGLKIRAAVKAVNTTFFKNSEIQAANVEISPTALTRPYIDPPSTARSADLPVYLYQTIGANYPTGARIFYTTDGSDPGSGIQPSGGTEYTGPFTTNSSDGSGVVNARFYGPSNYAPWFTTSSLNTSIYTVGAGGTGAVVGDANINGTYIGSLILTSTQNFNMNSGSIIKAGNLYVRGTPTIDTNNGGVIQGRQFLSDGTEVTPATDTRKIVDLDGSIQPSNYTIRLNSGAVIEGKVFRRVDMFAAPTVAQPPSPSNGNNLNVNSPTPVAVNPAQFANVNLNNGAGEVTLLSGNFGSMNANSGTTFVLGTAGSTTPTVYNFQSLNLNGGAQLKIVGPVILTVHSNININGGVIMGNPEHPEWLNLRIYSGNFSINSSAAAYADLTAPNSQVSLNGTFRGSVVAQRLTINGNGVAITQAIITDDEED